MDRHIRKAKKKAEGALKEVFSRSYIVEKIDRYWRYCYNAYMRALWRHYVMKANQDNLESMEGLDITLDSILAALAETGCKPTDISRTSCWMSFKLKNTTFLVSQNEDVTFVQPFGTSAQCVLMSPEKTARLMATYDMAMEHIYSDVEAAYCKHLSRCKAEEILTMTAIQLIGEGVVKSTGHAFRIKLCDNGNIYGVIDSGASWISDTKFRTSLETVREDFLKAWARF